MEQSRSSDRFATIASLIIGVVFIASGLSKLLLLPPVVRMFEAFHLSHWMLLAVGYVEVLTAVVLLIRRSRSYGAMGVCAVMAGAFLSHLMHPVYISMVFVEAAFFAVGLWLVKRERPAFLRPDWKHDPHQHRPRHP